MSIFVYHSYDYKLNWTPFSPITTINNIVGSVENWNLDIDHRSERFNTVLCQHIYAVLTCTISLSAVLPRDERRTVSPSSSSMAVMRNNENVGYDKLMVYFHNEFKLSSGPWFPKYRAISLKKEHISHTNNAAVPQELNLVFTIWSDLEHCYSVSCCKGSIVKGRAHLVLNPEVLGLSPTLTTGPRLFQGW